MPLDARKELGLLLQHLRLEAVVDKIEDLVADRGPDEPAQPRAGHGHDAEGKEGVERDLGDERLGEALGQDDGAGGAAREAGDDGEEQLDAPAAEAQLEEGVPVELCRGRIAAGLGVGAAAGVGAGAEGGGGGGGG